MAPLLPCYLTPVLGAMQFAPKDDLASWLRAWVWRIPVLRLKRLFLRPVVTERIVEVPFVLRRLPPEPGARVLDFGCSDSALPLEMAALGYRVTGVDLRPYPFSHPNLEFVQGDFLDDGRVRGPFDAVVAVSSVEHCGLEAYGARGRQGGDRAIVEKFLALLKPGGLLLLTVPYGLPGDNGGQRVYDAAGLAALIAGFELREARYYKGEDCRAWVEVRPGELSGVDSLSRYTQGAALVSAVKPI